jgi:Fe-S oxidoreductase
MYKHVFGPVPSRRLGISLGVDLVVNKSCNLNCVFCECGATKKIILDRKIFKDIEEIKFEIKEVLKSITPNYITFSGSGEPTLSLDLGNIINFIKDNLVYKGKIAVITNSLLLNNADVIKEIERADLLIPTLSTVNQEIFEKLVRPDKSTHIEEVKEGFIKMSHSNFKGEIWIEIFIIENVTDSYENIKGIIDFLKENKIRYDKIQLNTIDRVGADRNLKAISYFKLLEIEKIFKENNILNVEIIKKLDELDEKNKISINNELLNNMKQKRKYQQEEIDKIFKK